ncbi:MAG: helix-turn-helix domain-containing protein, partial [Magnetovibrio sp.]|nr:helix-turn-helix domain-containing protein [Magnetovibrio sp.]
MLRNRHITLDEREQIVLFRGQGFGPCQIARELKRAASTMSRGLKWNSNQAGSKPRPWRI